MKRLGLTVIGTVWVIVVLIAWIWLGIVTRAPEVYWEAGWLLTSAIACVPFVIYGFLGDEI